MQGAGVQTQDKSSDKREEGFEGWACKRDRHRQGQDLAVGIRTMQGGAVESEVQLV